MGSPKPQVSLFRPQITVTDGPNLFNFKQKYANRGVPVHLTTVRLDSCDRRPQVCKENDDAAL
ncbi:hypothetical protein SLEP1_g25780 [Rubroshorea leprosula]|uniref:Uncharacterized protein n=1 Tax=Rubroshorea leprosula TaxID=152421 RepID=A0AAV5JJV9_9ROSI|nr:hypothetical protein SLEP1_g25780 [Rubroshorea leprosula]